MLSNTSLICNTEPIAKLIIYLFLSKGAVGCGAQRSNRVRAMRAKTSSQAVLGISRLLFDASRRLTAHGTQSVETVLQVAPQL